jgi:uncharacterized protein (DUF1501 family)
MHMSRRFFLKSSGALAMYLGVTPLQAFAQSTAASTATTQPAAAALTAVRKGKTLVVIFLRGGMDGLNFVTPWKDPGYASQRRGLAIPAPRKGEGSAVDLDGFFGLHPRAAALKPLFDKKSAVAAHAVGYDLNTRSHFEEQDTWETGVTGNTINSDGWLNRHLATSEGHGIVRAVSVGDSLPRILRGEAPAYAIRGLDQLALPKSKTSQDVVAAALEHAYQKDAMTQRTAAQDMLADAGKATLEGVKQLRKVADMDLRSAVEYPNTELGRKLSTAARLIRADIGVEIVEVDLGGWDTHQYQGNGAGGQFGNLVGQFSDAVAAFNQDLGDRMNDVLVLTLSDFGRTVAENGSYGTDHGWGNCMLAMGGPVLATRAKKDAGPVVGKWPGLLPDQLHQGRDLKHTTDFRDVIAEAVRTHLGNEQLQTLLPNHRFTSPGLFTA